MQKLLENLEKRNFNPQCFETTAEAVDYIALQIDAGQTVSWGGSVSIDESGIKDVLREKGAVLLDRALAKNPQEVRNIYLQAFDCDAYLMSSNAISENGVLVNIDGNGNRLANLVYGSQKVFLLVGKNKICKTEEDALSRVRNITAPLNSKRLNKKTPCVVDGKCHDCLSPECICNHIVFTRHCLYPKRINVILVNENLGL